MSRAGQRNVKVIIEQKTENGPDSVGDPDLTWSAFSTQWTEVITQSGKEFLQAREQHSELTHILTTRFVSGVTPKMRVNNGGAYYNILAAFDPSKRRHKLKIYCSEQL